METRFERGDKVKPVKRLLRSCATQEYFKDDGWTRNPDEAREFCDSVEAAETCARHGLNGVELILSYNGGATEVFCTPMR